MGDSSYTIQISSNLVNQLTDDSGKLKKKTKKPKAKLPRETKSPQHSHSKVPQNQISDNSGPPVAGWPLQSPLFLPVPPPSQSANPELDAIKSVLQESEKVVEKLQKQEESMLQEVTQRAKDLHAKEFKLPNQKPMPCLEKIDACLQCYKENVKAPLKCASFVKDLDECVRRVRQQVSSADKCAT